MKILFTSEAVVQIYNGKYYARDLNQHLSQYNQLGKIICVCYAVDVDYPTLPEVKNSDAEFVFIKKINNLKSLLFDRAGNDYILSQLMLRKDVNAAICHVPSGSSSLAVKYAKLYNKPYMLVVVGCVWDSLWNYDWRGKLLAPLSYLKLKSLLASAPFALYVTRYFLQNRYPCNGITEYASDVCLDGISQDLLNERLKKIDNYSDSRPLNIITSAAVNVPYKGQEYVIRAISILNNKYNFNFHYHLLGSGDQTYLKKVARSFKAETYVHFIGSLPHDEVFAKLDEMDIYIQPSLTEGLPRALVEAMSRALPCIGTRIGGIPELLNEEALVKKGSVKDLIKILSNFHDKDVMKKQASLNWAKSKEYQFAVVDGRRKTFLNNFFETVVDVSKDCKI